VAAESRSREGARYSISSLELNDTSAVVKSGPKTKAAKWATDATMMEPQKTDLNLVLKRSFAETPCLAPERLSRLS